MVKRKSITLNISKDGIDFERMKTEQEIRNMFIQLSTERQQAVLKKLSKGKRK